jgi:hypothetical protein
VHGVAKELELPPRNTASQLVLLELGRTLGVVAIITIKETLGTMEPAIRILRMTKVAGILPVRITITRAITAMTTAGAVMVVTRMAIGQPPPTTNKQSLIGTTAAPKRLPRTIPGLLKRLRTIHGALARTRAMRLFARLEITGVTILSQVLAVTGNNRKMV